MPFDLPELLGPFLLPLLIAIPLAIVVIIISTRRGDDVDAPLRREPVPDRPPLRSPTAVAPAPVPAAPVPVPAPPAVAAPAGPARVMLVDDSAVVRAKLGKLLEGAGYEVLSARDGVEALELLGREHVHVLITDLEMPNKDGFELIADVQGSLETEDLPIIAITGHEELQGRVHQVQGLYGIFKKPWHDRELLKRVETLTSLRKPPAARV